MGMLAKLLQRFVVSPGSTSGIEQNFSMFKRSLGQQWNGSELSEERRLVLQLASNDNSMAFFASFADKLSGTSTLTRLLGFNGCGATMTLYDIASLDGRKQTW